MNRRRADPPATAPAGRTRSATLIVVAALVLGLAARGVALWLAPAYSYVPDHVSNMGWSTYAVEHGVWHIYDLPPRQPLVIIARDRRTGRVVRDPRTGKPRYGLQINAHPCNYPPASAYLFWLQGIVWHTLDPHVVALHLPRELQRRAGVAGVVRSRAVNTHASRFADAFPGLVFDLLLAWGVAALVGELGGERRRLRQALAFALTYVAPPVLLDSAFWNQADSWITCLLVWTLVLLIRRRLVAAGVVYGLALMTKPQAILLAPVLLYVLVAMRFGPAGSWRRALALWKAAAAAIVTVAVVAAPFMIADARAPSNPDGALRWFRRSYVETIGKPAYERTTLSAFNIWWFDLLAQGRPQSPAEMKTAWDTSRPLLGVRKALLGKLLLGLAIVLAWAFGGWRGGWTPTSWVACAMLVLLAAFALPTGVHERYIYYCIPFAIALAVCGKRWIAPAAALLLVGTFEMTSFRWAGYPTHLFAPGQPAARHFSLFLAALVVSSLLYGYLALLAPPPRETRA